MIDEGKLNVFIGQMLGDLGGASSIAMVRLGGSLGLYQTLSASGAMTSAQLAKAADVHERYLREWLSPSGGLQLSGLRCEDGNIFTAAGAGDGVRQRG